MNTGSKARKLLIVADCEVGRVFINTLERELNTEAEIFYIDLARIKAQKIIRHACYFLLALRACISRRKYNYIVFWQQFMGFYYGILMGRKAGPARNPVFCGDIPYSLTLQLIYKKRKGLFGRIYGFLYRFFLDSGALDKFICHSAKEREWYVQELGDRYRDKICFIKYGLKMPGTGQIQDVGGKNRYFFSGGTSNRDYRTLIEAFRGSREKLKILCLPGDVEGLKVPPNVEILHNVFEDGFFECMRNAYAVIITLGSDPISSGQLVLLDAMRLGKAIIVTRNAGTEEYGDDRCVLFVKPHSAGEIIAAVNRLVNNDKELCGFAREARIKYEANFTIEIFADRIASVLKDGTGA